VRAWVVLRGRAGVAPRGAAAHDAPRRRGPPGSSCPGEGGNAGRRRLAAVDFVEATGRRAVIGALDDLPAILEIRGGTVIGPDDA